ncbi:hypothetical protein AKJ16_DCAP24962 [Drosera capensis]
MDSGATDEFHHLPQVICFSHNPQFHVPFDETRVRVFLIWGLIDSLFNAPIGFVESVYDGIIHRTEGILLNQARLNELLHMIGRHYRSSSHCHVGVVTCEKCGDQTMEF